MKKILLGVILVVVFGSLSMVNAQEGFAVWSKGGGCERELHYSKISDGMEVGEPKLFVKKSTGADIWPVISYDGQWVAWSRANSAWKGRYGECDYHNFEKYELYIAKIQYGQLLNVKAIRVDQGYLPSWGDDAKTPDGPKTLYYTHYATQTIKKTVINKDGTFSAPTLHHQFKQGMGTNAHIQMSPDGKFLLYRPGKIKVYSLELKKDICGSLGGCHPCWGPRSKYFIRSQNGAFFNTGTSVKSLGSGGVGSYFQGFSNDAYWDEGRLWTIGRVGGSGQNGAGTVTLNEVAIDGNGGWKLGKKVVIGKGSACDVHFFPKDFDPNKQTSTLPGTMNSAQNSIAFTTQIKTTASGLQLVVFSTDKEAKTAELFDMQGNIVASMKMAGSIKNSMPINSLVNGNYILKISGGNVAVQKSIVVMR